MWRSGLLLGLLVAATVDGRVRRPRVGAEGAVWIHGWCRRIVEALGIECRVMGRMPASGAVVSNHLSYLDIVLYSAVRPFVMVSKKEVRSWPLLGWLTAQAGTVYVERGGGPARHAEVNAWMAEAYATGLPVLFFPEGTTTDGNAVLPFRRGLFHSVLNRGVALRTAALRYAVEEGSLEEDVCYWGDMEFAPHLFKFLGLDGVRAEIAFGDEVEAREDRFILAESAWVGVAELYGALGVEATETHPLTALEPVGDEAAGWI